MDRVNYYIRKSFIFMDELYFCYLDILLAHFTYPFIGGWTFQLFPCVVSLQSCPTLCHSMGYSLPGSFVLGILQAGTLEWVAVPFSSGSSRPRDWTRVSCVSCIGRWSVVSTFWLLYIMRQSIWMHRYLFEPVCNSFGHLSRSGIARSYDTSMFIFLRNHQTVCYSNFTIFYSHQQYAKIPTSPHPHQHLLAFLKKIVTVLLLVLLSRFSRVRLCVTP